MYREWNIMGTERRAIIRHLKDAAVGLPITALILCTFLSYCTFP